MTFYTRRFGKNIRVTNTIFNLKVKFCSLLVIYYQGIRMFSVECETVGRESLGHVTIGCETIGCETVVRDHRTFFLAVILERISFLF